jgi:CheY-like chemotaxis protein
VNTPTILLVDDEKPVLTALKAQLRREFGRRFVIETAQDGAEAWEVIEELQDEGEVIVVVVSDWLMPGVRGDELLLRIGERYPGIVRIMLTGQADAAAIERVIEDAGAHSVLGKPWRIDELRGAIEAGLAA